MKNCMLAVALALLCTALPSRAADGFIYVRISVKFILDSNGNRPASGDLDTDSDVQAQIERANTILGAYHRGYRLYVNEIINVTGLESFFTRPARSSTVKQDLEDTVTASPVTYAYRNSAVNIYVNGSDSSGVCSRGNGTLILLGQSVRDETILHETGHFLGLCHTQGCPCGGCGEAADPPECETVPASDEISDTLPDLACWTQDDIAAYSYFLPYANLPASLRDNVDLVFFNVMSYHDARDRFSSGQLDRWTDTANDERSAVSTGRTWFVDASNGDNGNGGLDHDDQLQSASEGINRAASGDVVLLRANTYSRLTTSWTFNKAVSLRATRGNATLRAIPPP